MRTSAESWAFLWMATLTVTLQFWSCEAAMRKFRITCYSLFISQVIISFELLSAYSLISEASVVLPGNISFCTNVYYTDRLWI